MTTYTKHCVSLTFFFTMILLCFAAVPAFSQDKDLSAENKPPGVLKIPPPLEGVETVSKHAAQKLEVHDISILTAKGAQLNYRVEVAQTKHQQAVGMMYRDTVKPNTGMLFVFDNEADRSFWMKNTWVPLDIIFVRADGVVHHIHRMAEPKSLDKIPSNGAIKAVLEIAGGMAEAHNINIGDRIIHDVFFGQPKENTL